MSKIGRHAYRQRLPLPFAATLILAGMALATLTGTGVAAAGSREPYQGYVRFFPTISQPSFPITFAVIGDYGLADPNEAAVANLVKRWNPAFVITTGDNNYPSGASATIDQNVGQYYAGFIHPYTGSYTPTLAVGVNRFFPSLGNHDWIAPGATPYLSYFTLPGNERYYDLVQGPVHLFAIDSDPNEPHGVTATSTQAQWLHARLSGSTSCWQVVFFHHAPYSSSAVHGSTTYMRWPFQMWGADVVMSGHDHTYERILISGFPYFVNGAGGHTLYTFGTPIAGSQVRYNARHGAMRVTASRTKMIFEFINIDGVTVDSFTIQGGCS
jgi:hypothetical protein